MFTLYPLKLKLILYNRSSKASEVIRMAVLTMNNAEFRTFPQILQDYASYTTAIRGNSKKTVCEYLLDLRTFFRFMRMREEGLELSMDEFETLSISHVTIEDVKRITTQNIIDFLMFIGAERENSTTTRMRKLSAIKSFFNYLYHHIIIN